MRQGIVSFALFTILPFALTAGVNTIYLNDGRTYSGQFLSGDGGSVNFRDDQGQQYRFRTSEVQSITFGGPNSDNAGYRNSAPPAYVNQTPGPSGATIPPGTQLSVRTTTSIDSRGASDGQVFQASVEQDVLDANGNVLIPRGSNAELTIRSANGGSIRTSSDLLLDVQDVTVNGRRYMVNTEDLQRAGAQGVGGNRRTAEFVGGGTALGAILGAVAGGGRGAAIGALAGAATGAGTELLTKGNQVKIPSETVLTFRLDQPLMIQ